MLNQVLFGLFLFLLFIALFGKQLGSIKLGRSVISTENLLRNASVPSIIIFSFIVKRFVQKQIAVDTDLREETKTGTFLDSVSICQGPLKTIDQLNEYISQHPNPPSSSIHARVTKHNKSAICPKLLVCHDMKGGYLDDVSLQGSNLNNHFEIYNWHIIDAFIYFSHSLISIPPVAWVKQCRQYGVMVLGTFITEWRAGEDICRNVIFANEASAVAIADKLSLVARHAQLDGWFVNIENPCIGLTGTIITFIKRIRSNGLYVLWYDSVTIHGDLEWQNKLNQKNMPFFEASDGIFLNYNWEKAEPAYSGARADEFKDSRRRYDVYFGIDVFGRGRASAGGFETHKAMELLLRSGVSTAIFAPGWLYEKHCNGGDGAVKVFWDGQLQFWRAIEQTWTKEAFRWAGLERMMSANKKTAITNDDKRCSIDLFASFSLGMGRSNDKFFLNGYPVLTNNSWFNPSLTAFGPINMTAFDDVIPSILPFTGNAHNERNSLVSCKSLLEPTISFNGTSCLSVEICDSCIDSTTSDDKDDTEEEEEEEEVKQLQQDDDDYDNDNKRGRGIFHVPLLGYNDDSVTVLDNSDGSIYSTLPSPWPKSNRLYIRATYAIQIKSTGSNHDSMDVCFRLNVEPRACSDVLVREIILTGCRRVRFGSDATTGGSVDLAECSSSSSSSCSFPSSACLIPDDFAKIDRVEYYNNPIQNDDKVVVVDLKEEKDDLFTRKLFEVKVDASSPVRPNIISKSIDGDYVQLVLHANKDDKLSDYASSLHNISCHTVSASSDIQTSQSIDSISSPSKKTGIVVLDKSDSAEKAKTPSVAIKFSPLLHLQHSTSPPLDKAYSGTTAWISAVYALPDTLSTWIRTIRSMDLVLVSMTCPSSSCRVLVNSVSISNDYESQTCDFYVSAQLAPPSNATLVIHPSRFRLSEIVTIMRKDAKKFELSLDTSSKCEFHRIDVFQRIEGKLFWHGAWCNLTNTFLVDVLSCTRITFVLQPISASGVRFPISFCDEFHC